MPPLNSYIQRVFCAALLCAGALLSNINAQEPNAGQTPPDKQSDDVIRINTDLVQTDVTVVDKAGRLIDNLQREQFVLMVDGKPQPITFFERVAAGSFNEEAQLAAARGAARATSSKETTVRPLDRGRVIFFFVDDLHLSFDSLSRTRKMLLRFIHEELGQNDQAAIVSTSGQTGFLGQLTDNKTVLRAAVERLAYRNNSTRDSERPAMSEYQALAVDRRDTDALGYFIDELLRDNPGMRRDTAESLVANRARQILERGSFLTTNTLATLDSLARTASKLPGRKLGFFISDGFFLDTRTSDVVGRLRRLTDGAARSGLVLYTMDARGLSTGFADASSDVAFDPSGRLSRVDLGEISASQEALYTLASETGGRALVNTNALDKALTRTLKETSVYYLLAWQPEQIEGRKNDKFRTIKVSIKDRPELTVMARKGFFTSAPPAPVAKRDKKNRQTKATDSDKSPDGELRATLFSFYPQNDLPTSLFIGYVDVPDAGAVLTTIVQVEVEKSSAPTNEVTPKMVAEVVSAVFDDKGKPVSSLKDQITLNPTGGTVARRSPVVFSRQFQLAPGLYQVRVAAREIKTGRLGSALQWIEIPKIARGEFALSSLFIGEHKANEAGDGGKTGAAAVPDVPLVVSADRRFARGSQLRFLAYVYNAARASGKPPDVALQVQVFRDDQPVITAPLSKVSTNGITDLARLPYLAEISLNKLPPGQYVLQVTVIDRTAKTSVSQRAGFVVE
ncbi:MAG: VWA domain-containing protein [Pyrinomonadaceae bacterium]